jgi:hypothetical protein
MLSTSALLVYWTLVLASAPLIGDAVSIVIIAILSTSVLLLTITPLSDGGILIAPERLRLKGSCVTSFLTEYHGVRMSFPVRHKSQLISAGDRASGCTHRGPGQARNHRDEIVSPVEVVFGLGKVAWDVLGIDGAVCPGEYGLDVSQHGVDPFEGPFAPPRLRSR